MPLFLNGIMSELIIVAITNVSQHTCKTCKSRLIFRLTHSHKSRSPNPRHSSHTIQRQHAFRHSTPKTPQGKKRRGHEEASPPTKNVRHPPVQRLERSRGNEVRRSQPGGAVSGIELGADDGVSGGGDCAVEAVEEDVCHDGQLDGEEARGGRPGFIGGGEERRVFLGWGTLAFDVVDLGLSVVGRCL